MCRYRLRIGRFYELKAEQERTQGSIGKALGEQRSKINRIINGHKTCPADLAKKWSDLMGVPVEELFEEAVSEIRVK